MNPEYLGPMMFFAAFGCIFSGYPVAFTLGGTALTFAGIALWMGEIHSKLLLLFPLRVYGVMSNQLLLAVPFFILMGLLNCLSYF